MDNITLFHKSPSDGDKGSLEKQLVDNYRLTTAEIFYHFPDHPSLLQTYIWQDYDIAPKFPELIGFLNFWKKEIDGKVHSVYVASKELITASELYYSDGEFRLQ